MSKTKKLTARKKLHKEFIFKSKLSFEIIIDRYGGTYSGGNGLLVVMDGDSYGHHAEDIEAGEYWDEQRSLPLHKRTAFTIEEFSRLLNGLDWSHEDWEIRFKSLPYSDTTSTLRSDKNVKFV